MAVMRGEVARPYWDDIGLVKLLAGFFIGPVAWLLNLQINYSLVKWACASGNLQVLPLLSAAALVLVGGGIGLSWWCVARLRTQATARGGHVVDRSYFLAVAGLWLNALFALLILTSGSLHFIVSPCE
jgi:hypothetical protein